MFLTHSSNRSFKKERKKERKRKKKKKVGKGVLFIYSAQPRYRGKRETGSKVIVKK